MWVFITNEAFAFLVFFIPSHKAIPHIHVDFLHKSNKHLLSIKTRRGQKVGLALPSFLGAVGKAKEGMCVSKISRWGGGSLLGLVVFGYKREHLHHQSSVCVAPPTKKTHFSHTSKFFCSFFFATSPIKLKLGLQVGGRD
jgi:hypothetical protein